MEPLEFRRRQARRFGAGRAVAPGEALTAVKAVAPKGADLVLEMVGHNQEIGGMAWMGMEMLGSWDEDEIYEMDNIMR